jgi:hypothetical protein
VQNYKRERTYGNNPQRGLSKEQERWRQRKRGNLSGFTRLRIKTQVAKPKKYTLGSSRD